MKILVAGDFCPRDRVAVAFEKEDYASVLEEVRGITVLADYSIVNYECPVVTGGAMPIEKHGPNLKSTPKGIEAVKWAGFNCVTLANNHFRDYGDKGVIETLGILETRRVDYTGGGKNLEEASHIFYKEITGKILAIINCCEHEFSVATNFTAGSNPLNPICQYRAIQEARKNADKVLVIVHGGHEQFKLPSPRMVETYRFFIEAGADAVVNHHQHCYSGYEIYQGKPIFYGLGNFCFDNPTFHDGDWTEGYAVILDFSSETPFFTLYPYFQCNDKPKVSFLSQDAFAEKIQNLNAIIASPNLLKEEIDNYYASCSRQYCSIFEPFYNKYYLTARFRGWIPSLIGKKRKLAASNYVQCESHRDKLVWWLNQE